MRTKVTKNTRERYLKYTKGNKSIVAKTSLPPPLNPGPIETLEDGSILQAIKNPNSFNHSLNESLLPPLSRPNKSFDSNPRSILSLDQIEEMKNLRNSNPKIWTISALMKKFNVTRFFVSRLAPLNKEWKDKLNQEELLNLALLGEKYRQRRILRLKRASMLEESYHHFNF